jgi:nicotinamide-nucleotide amidase
MSVDVTMHLTPEEKSRVSWFPPREEIRFEDVVEKSKNDAHSAAYDIIKLLSAKSSKGNTLQVATAESLTGGYMFSTLVDVPIGGAVKYGCFSVYDTDAKRIFLGVEVEDVYTHACAKEMAIGVLKNSNATLAVAVTGNAMPWQGAGSEHEIKKLGEVFIGVAGYVGESEIVSRTWAMNFCNQPQRGSAMCSIWYNTVLGENSLARVVPTSPEYRKQLDGYNEFFVTGMVASYIRAQTTAQAFRYACDFVQTHNLIVPDRVKTSRVDSDSRKIAEMERVNGKSTNNKLLDRDGIVDMCDNANCTSLRYDTGGKALLEPRSVN